MNPAMIAAWAFGLALVLTPGVVDWRAGWWHGKAAGFLAKDWFAPAVAPLGELSFDLHRSLAAQHGGRERWGYCESVSYSLDREDDANM